MDSYRPCGLANTHLAPGHSMDLPGCLSHRRLVKSTSVPASGFPLAVLGLALLSGLSIGSQALAHENHGAVKEDGRFTPNDGKSVFPPQPRDIKDVRQHTPTSSSPMMRARARAVGNSADADARTDASLAAALRNHEVEVALGRLYSMTRSSVVDDKESARGSQLVELEFFSLSNNQTVQVTFDADRLVDLTLVEATESQPPLSETEKKAAIELAADYWETQGQTGMLDLTGYAIQTFLPDGGSYPNRVAYVSFHSQSPEPPELLTWVDLTNGQIIRGEVAR